ncbi:MAG: HAD family phosphatase [Balneolales bacterium]
MNNSFGVIFDMDGVLVDSNPKHKESLNLFFREHNKEISEDFLEKKIFGRTNTEWIREVFGDIPNETALQIAHDKESLFRDIFNPKEEMVPGLKEFLNMVKEKGTKLAVATSAPVENVDFILSELSIKDHFDVILDSSHVTTGKPDPEIYLKTSRALGFSPDRCIVFEDSLAGVESARRAKARVIGITTTHTPEELSDCDKIIDSFENLTLEDLSALFD